MMCFTAQIQRIQSKLITAVQRDKDYTAMGSEKHHYQLGEPLSKAELTAFETAYQLRLPVAFRAFLQHVDNGGRGRPYAAGPFYGLYPLGKNTDELVYYHPEKWLKQPCILNPTMTDDEWEALVTPLLADELSDADNERLRGELYAGLLPLGTQGCTFFHALVLSGEWVGRVVNVDLDYGKPQFSYESHFLDWYERWLDEVISGEQLGEDAAWFGYTRAGTAAELLQAYQHCTNSKEKAEYLAAIESKRLFNQEEIDWLTDTMQFADSADSIRLLHKLCQLDYTQARPYLQALGEQDLASLFRCLHEQAADKSPDWLGFIQQHIDQFSDTEEQAEAFRFCTYAMLNIHENTGFDYGEMLVPFTRYRNEAMQTDALYALGQLSNAVDYLDVIIPALASPSPAVVHTALQALPQPIDKTLLPHLQQVARRYHTETNYILANIDVLLEPFSLNHRTIRRATL